MTATGTGTTIESERSAIARALAFAELTDPDHGLHPLMPVPSREALVGIADRERREEVAAMLCRNGCDVTAHADGFHLVERLADAILGRQTRRRPDIIIADAILRGCSGVTLLEGLRQLEWDTPVILLTDRSVAISHRWAWRAVSGVFTEPFDIDALEAFVRFALDPESVRAHAAGLH